MRRRTFLLAVGLTAYFIGASVRAYLRYSTCSYSDVGCRIVDVVENPRVALSYPVAAFEYLIADVRLGAE